MAEVVSFSSHSHSEAGSHGENVHHESDISSQQKALIPARSGFVDSTTDHDSTGGLEDIFGMMRSKGAPDHPHMAGIEISTPGHVIAIGPAETMIGIEHRLGTRKMLAANKELLRRRDYRGVTANVLDMLDRLVGQNDKVTVILPHMLDTLKSGVVAKYPAEESLEIMRSRHVRYLEAFNGMNSWLGNYYNAGIAILAKEYLHGKGMLVGSDAHWPGMMGSNLNLLEVGAKDEDSILKALYDGRVVGFENLRPVDIRETKEWALRRVRESHYDMTMKTYNNGWTKDSSFSKIAGVPPAPWMIRRVINYAVKNPGSGLWDALTELSSGVNRLYEVFRMTPAYKKFVSKLTDGRTDSYPSIDQRSFRRDPVAELEKIAVVPRPYARAQGLLEHF